MENLELPDAEDFSTSSSFKQAVYDRIEDGVPGWLFDLKLEIIWRKTHGKELEDYMKEVLE